MNCDELEAELKDARAKVETLLRQARGYRSTLRSVATWLDWHKPESSTFLQIQVNDALEGKYLEVPTKE